MVERDCCRKCQQVYLESLPFPQSIEHRFIVCSECGNKRCPKATNHELQCTGSNEPGQVGSVFEAWQRHGESDSDYKKRRAEIERTN